MFLLSEQVFLLQFSVETLVLQDARERSAGRFAVPVGNQDQTCIIEGRALRFACIADNWETTCNSGDCASATKVDPSSNAQHGIRTGEYITDPLRVLQSKARNVNGEVPKEARYFFFRLGGATTHKQEAKPSAVGNRRLCSVYDVFEFFPKVRHARQAEYHDSFLSSVSVELIFDYRMALRDIRSNRDESCL